MTNDIDLTKINGWRDLIVRWLVAQGVSTILLFAMLLGLYWGVPQWLQQIAAGYDRFADQMARDQAKDRELFERLLKEVRATKEAVKEGTAADKESR